MNRRIARGLMSCDSGVPRSSATKTKSNRSPAASMLLRTIRFLQQAHRDSRDMDDRHGWRQRAAGDFSGGAERRLADLVARWEALDLHHFRRELVPFGYDEAVDAAAARSAAADDRGRAVLCMVMVARWPEAGWFPAAGGRQFGGRPGIRSGVAHLHEGERFRRRPGMAERQPAAADGS